MKVQVPLSFDIGHGWRAVQAQTDASSSIALVKIEKMDRAVMDRVTSWYRNKPEAHVYVRLDLDKHMLIDRPPVDVDSNVVDGLVEQVVTAEERDNHTH